MEEEEDKEDKEEGEQRMRRNWRTRRGTQSQHTPAMQEQIAALGDLWRHRSNREASPAVGRKTSAQWPSGEGGTRCL